MWCRKTDPERLVTMASVLLLGGAIPLAVAYLSQVVGGLYPCHFCLLQRYPYGLVILAGLGTLAAPRMSLIWRLCVAFGILGLLATGILGLIHTGIERHWLEYTGGCVAPPATGTSLEALRAAIAAAPLVSCNEPSFLFLTLSMASWNSLWAGFMLLLIALQYRFEQRRYDRIHS